MKHKTRGKPPPISFHLFIEAFGGHTIQFRQIRIHHNPLAANHSAAPRTNYRLLRCARNDTGVMAFLIISLWVSEHLVGKSTLFLSVSALSYFSHPPEFQSVLYFQLVRTAKQVGTAPAILRRGSRTYSDLGREEPTMREKMVKLAKQAGKLLAIELFVPGGTLVVLAILLARGGKSMTDTVMIVGLISALVLNLWGAALSVISSSS